MNRLQYIENDKLQFKTCARTILQWEVESRLTVASAPEGWEWWAGSKNLSFNSRSGLWIFSGLFWRKEKLIFATHMQMRLLVFLPFRLDGHILFINMFCLYSSWANTWVILDFMLWICQGRPPTAICTFGFSFCFHCVFFFLPTPLPTPIIWTTSCFTRKSHEKNVRLLTVLLTCGMSYAFSNLKGL